MNDLVSTILLSGATATILSGFINLYVLRWEKLFDRKQQIHFDDYERMKNIIVQLSELNISNNKKDFLSNIDNKFSISKKIYENNMDLFSENQIKEISQLINEITSDEDELLLKEIYGIPDEYYDQFSSDDIYQLYLKRLEVSKSIQRILSNNLFTCKNKILLKLNSSQL